jgi:RNA polymerase sigma factor (sigma-70 family)
LSDGDADIELLDAWRRGDRRAGDELFRTYYPQVLGYFRLRAPEVAEDLTQRTFLACTEGRAPITSFRGYLFGTARNVFSRHMRTSGRRARQASLPLPKMQSSLTPSSLVALRQEHFLLLQALHQIKREQQEVLALHYVHSLRAREIAEAMEIPVSTVTTRLARARDALRTQVMSLDAPQTVRGALADDLETWTRSLGPIVHEESVPRRIGD